MQTTYFIRLTIINPASILKVSVVFRTGFTHVVTLGEKQIEELYAEMWGLLARIVSFKSIYCVDNGNA